MEGKKVFTYLAVGSLWTFIIFCMGTAFVCKNRPAPLVHNKIMKAIMQSADHPWQSVDGRYCTVYYPMSESQSLDLPAEANMIARLADSYFPMIQNDFDWKTPEKLNFVLYQDKGSMADALNLDVQQLIPMGAYYQGNIAVLSPALWIENASSAEITDEFVEKGPVVHEMVHCALDKKTNGNYPMWFTEGVALYYEKKYLGVEWRPDLEEKSREITMEQLSENFRELPTATAYRKCYDCVAQYVERYGESALQDYITKLK